MKTLSTRRKTHDRILKSLLYLSGGLTCALLVFLIGFIFYRGLGSISWKLLSTQSSYLKETIGILPNILNTLYMILVAMLIALPVGVGAAIYLTEYAANRRFVRLVEFATETLTGIPSIIFGLVGMLLFIQIMGLQQGILAGGLTLVDHGAADRDPYDAGESQNGAPVLSRGRAGPGRRKVAHDSHRRAAKCRWTALSRAAFCRSGASWANRLRCSSPPDSVSVLNGFIELLCRASSATLTVALYVYASERGETGVAFGDRSDPAAALTFLD
jgi:phosphate transport system permease protein